MFIVTLISGLVLLCTVADSVNRLSIQTSDKNQCVIPRVANAVLSFLGQQTHLKEGEKIAVGSAILILCKESFTHDQNTSSPLVFCAENGVFVPTFPNCINTCASLTSTASITFVCEKNGKKDSCKSPTSGTIAKFECVPFHNAPQEKSNIRKCLDGSWDYGIPQCEPVCGYKKVNSQQLILEGNTLKEGNSPWHIALFRKINGNYAYVCGGSLISDNAVLTAAQCVTRYTDSTVLPKEEFKLGVGKYYISYNDTRDTFAQFYDVEKIIVHKNYNGVLKNYESDIGIVILNKKLSFSSNVFPVCIDYLNEPYESQLLGSNGIISTWGRTNQKENFTDKLSQISLPYVNNLQCAKDLPKDFQRYLLRDKFCSGYLNKGIGVCRGSSGSGISFVNPNNKQYYLRGIVNLGPAKWGDCDLNQYTLYTKVSEYIDFIKESLKN